MRLPVSTASVVRLTAGMLFGLDLDGDVGSKRRLGRGVVRISVYGIERRRARPLIVLIREVGLSDGTGC
jgi:hypothetical protein